MTQRRRKIIKMSSYFGILFITFAMIEVSKPGVVRCPRYCLCYFDSKTNMRTVSCVARRLGNTDLSIPRRVQSLDLSNNSISVLEDRAFQSHGLIELVDLVIKHNSIQFMGLHSFAGLSYLQSLDLTDNSLYQILPWTFHDNSNLKFISLSENPLGHSTHSGPFLDVPSLEVLLLSKCSFAHFPEDAFSALPNLRILDLSNNQLINFDVYPLEFLSNLEELNILSNPWKCNNNLENLRVFLESQSSKLIGPSCGLPQEVTHITTQQSKFEKIISIVNPEYEDISASDESLEDKSDETDNLIIKESNNCTLVTNTEPFYNKHLFLPPEILSLVSFLFGVCVTLFIGYFCMYYSKHKKIYQPIQPLVTMPTQTEFESSVVIQTEEIETFDETILCPETPPPSYRELFMSYS